MIYSRLFITLFISTNLFWAQEHSEFYNRPFVIFEGCDNAEDKERCYKIKLHELIGENLNAKDFRDAIFVKAKRDTITVHTSITYNEKGFVVKDYSRISNPLNGEPKGMESVLNSIPVVKPVLDDYDNGVASSVQSLFGFLLDRSKDSIVPILGYIPKEVPFSIIEKVPIYRGCNKRLNNKELKQCMADKIAKLVSKNFNVKLAKKLGLSPGIKRIYVHFKIDKKGNVIDVKSRGPHSALEQEAIRVIKKIPKLKKPGYQSGKRVIVPYSLPIVFRVEN